MDAVARAPMLSDIIMPLLQIRTEALRQVAQLSKAMLRHTREDDACRRLMSIPGVAVTFVATIDDPARFRHSRSVACNYPQLSEGILNPIEMSISRCQPLHMTIFPGGGS